MGFRQIAITSALVATAAIAYACGSSTPAATTTAPSPTLASDTLSGTVPLPVNGALQSAFNTFVVGQGGGAVTVTLTSAIETLPGNNLLTTVIMGLGVGTVSNGACALLASAYTTGPASTSTALSGSLTAGTYCVQVTDVTNQVGPVAYAVVVSHP